MLCANVNERLSWDDYFNHPFFKKQFNQDNQINFPQFNFFVIFILKLLNHIVLHVN